MKMIHYHLYLHSPKITPTTIFTIFHTCSHPHFHNTNNHYYKTLNSVWTIIILTGSASFPVVVPSQPAAASTKSRRRQVMYHWLLGVILILMVKEMKIGGKTKGKLVGPRSLSLLGLPFIPGVLKIFWMMGISGASMARKLSRIANTQGILYYMPSPSLNLYMYTSY